MQIIRTLSKIDTTNKMTVAFDVCKKKLNYYSEISGKLSGTDFREKRIIQDEVPNSTVSVLTTLQRLSDFSREKGHSGLHIVCEPTGIYSNLLMQTARKQGYSTAYVSGESVHKAKVIEDQTNSKNDVKDPRIIYMLSMMGKELVYRQLPARYQQLRELNRLYETADGKRTEARCELHHLLIRLFPDYPMSRDFFFTDSGETLIRRFYCNPYRIAAISFKTFSTKMKKDSPNIFRSTLDKLYKAAQCSSRHFISRYEFEILEQRLKYLFEDYQLADKRKREVRMQIEQIYEELVLSEEVIPLADGKVLKSFHIGRILGETGPLGDFCHWRMLFKYGGLNLRTRESGAYKGKIRMSKKGRSRLRGVLGKLVFRLIKKKELFGPYFHRRKEENIPGTKIMAMVERKLLRMVFAMAKKREAFNEHRFNYCESQYLKAA